MNKKVYKFRQKQRSLFNLFLAAFLFGQIFIVNAQNSMPRMQGTTQNSYDLSGFENINLFNGKLSFNLPLLKIAGRGDANVSVNYSLIHKWEVVGDRQIGYQIFPQSFYRVDAGFVDEDGDGSILDQETSQFDWYETNPTSCGTVFYQPSQATFSFKITNSGGSSHILRSGSGAPISVPYCFATQAGVNLGKEFISWEGDGVKFVADLPIYFNERLRR